jgi:outer membrane protein
MRLVLIAVVAVSAPIVCRGQGPASGPVLTLEESIQLALRNNPQHQMVRSNRARAGNALRSAYGALLPGVSSSFGASWREGRQQFFEGQPFGAASDVVSSNAGVSVGASWSGSTLMGPRQQRALLDASELDLSGSEQSIRAAVVQDYLSVLQAQARAALQDTLLINTQAQLDLARARLQVGAATSLEVRNAEVQLGRQRVAVLRERNNVENARLQLFQRLGIPEQEGARLTTAFPMAEPALQLAELLDMARRGNPTMSALKARESAANIGVSSARTAWFPTLSLSTGISGYTSQQSNIDAEISQARAQAEGAKRSCFTQDSIRRGAGLSGIGASCNAINFTDAQANALRDANSQFPFTFTRNPISYGASLSFPIFNGFQRERQIQEAQLARNDARYRVREQELRLTAEVTTAYRTLITQFQTVQFNDQSQQAAREAVLLAQERYRVGAATFLDVTTAQNQLQSAATEYINSIYDFHKAYAALENAVGRPLR